MNFRRLALNAAALAGGGVVAQLCFVTIEAEIARTLGRGSYGIYGAVYAIALAIVLVADVGMNSKLIEDGARDRSRIGHLLGTMVVLKSLICVAVYPAAIWLLPRFGYSPAIVGFFSVFFVYAVLFILLETFAAAYYARERMHINAVFQAATPLAMLVATFAALWLAPGLRSVAWAYILGAGIVVGVWGYLIFVGERPKVDFRQTAYILRGSYLYGLTSAIYQVSLRLDLMLLSLWSGLGDVGLYVAGDKLADLGLKVGVMYSRVITPMLFAQSRHGSEAYRRSCKIALRAVAVFGMLGCLILALLAKPLLIVVFGASFGSGSDVVGVLALSLFARLVVTMLQVTLSSSGEHKRRTGSMAFALGAAAAANVTLIPVYGIIGAAVARTIGDAVQVGALLGARNLPIGRGAAGGWIFGPLVLGVTAYLSVRQLPIHYALQVVVALAVYSLGLLALGMVRVSELRALAAGLGSAERKWP